MKTDNIYIAELGISKYIKHTGTLYDYICGDGIITNIKYAPIKYVLVKKCHFCLFFKEKNVKNGKFRYTRINEN